MIYRASRPIQTESTQNDKPYSLRAFNAGETLRELLDVLHASARVLIVFPRGATGATSTLPHVNKLIHPLVVLFEDASIVHLLLTVRRVDWVRRLRLGEIFVGYLFFAELLEVLDPVQADAFALHRLGAPEHGVRNLTIEQRAQRVLFRLFFAFDCFILRINRHHGVDDARIQERHARFQAVSHRHAIGTLAVHVVQVTKDATEFVVHVVGARCIAEVEVAGEKLIGAFAREDHLDVLRRELSQEVVRNGGSDELRLVGFKMVNHVFDVRTRLFGGEKVLVMLRAQELGHHTSGRDVGRTLLTDGERQVLLPTRLKKRL
mmetsp:Transcript_5920/g.23367  ORF Transcript_5920/g.23367 Transcript_5920/m.23367 type:complete len:319 (-) Transcript_5920:1069-2025(-)